MGFQGACKSYQIITARAEGITFAIHCHNLADNRLPLGKRSGFVKGDHLGIGKPFQVDAAFKDHTSFSCTGESADHGDRRTDDQCAGTTYQ